LHCNGFGPGGQDIKKQDDFRRPVSGDMRRWNYAPFAPAIIARHTLYFKPAFPLQPEISNQTNYKKGIPRLQINAEKIFIFSVRSVNTGGRFLTGEFCEWISTHIKPA
jgi:hypothetical protein